MKIFDWQIIKDTLFICILAAVFGFTINIVHPRGFALISKEKMQYRKIVSLTLTEARRKYHSSLFIDSRDSIEYKYAHINGALNIPVSSVIENEKNRADLPEEARDKEIVIYCGGRSCGSSEVLARHFIKNGYPGNIYIIKDGFPGWESRNYPVERAGKDSK